jgi:polyisoprenoid-binding protein YceI
MENKTMRTFAVIAVALVGMSAQISLEPTSKVWVQGDSTVRAFTCNATEINSALTTTESKNVASLVSAAKVTIPVAKLDCGNGKMNEHMRKALLASQNQNIEFELKSYKVDGTAAVLSGTLTMAGTTREVEISGTAAQEDDLVRVKAQKQINMKDWGIKPPSLMMGAMKVKESVTVGFDVTLKP